jgi:hypothetical protein
MKERDIKGKEITNQLKNRTMIPKIFLKKNLVPLAYDSKIPPPEMA